MKLIVALTAALICFGSINAWMSPRPHRNSMAPRAVSRNTAVKSTVSSELDHVLNNLNEKTLPLLHISDRIGSGSYGTVHKGYLIKSKDDIEECVTKRAWSNGEIKANVPKKINDMDNVVAKTGLAYAKKDNVEEILSSDEVKKRGERCRHYWEVERHCFQKLEYKKSDGDDSLSKAVPSFLGTYSDDGSGSQSDVLEGYGLMTEKKEGGWFNTEDDKVWMAFAPVKSVDNSASALTLLDAMKMDLDNRNNNRGFSDHLAGVQKAMGLPDSYEFGEVLDTVFESLLESIQAIHAANIVHRDLKPGNLLCDPESQRLRIIDFGSAADLDPSTASKFSASNIFSGGKVRVGLDEGIVALSPVYAAPETFVKIEDNPTSFDVFSAALIICQLLFNLLDERTDAGFYQQLKDVEYNLDSWLENQLKAKLRPAGLDDALEYLGERRGLWRVMKRMLQPNPSKRISSKDVLAQFKEVMDLKSGLIEWSDPIIIKVAKEEAYFETVIDSYERCDINYDLLDDSDSREMPRPLHFLASFNSNKPIGLVLSEASNSYEKDESMKESDWKKWKDATQNSLPGEVFVKGWSSGGQADSLGLFEIGDRLRGVGELPFVDGGFDGAVKLIEKQPKTGGTIRLHFDRQRSETEPLGKTPSDSRCVKVTGQGAWKSKGRRNSQEDNFLLHEVKNSNIGDVMLCGVLDGHGGTAASESVAKIMPPLFSEELELSDGESNDAIREALEKSWELTCTTYRDICENGECVVDYDPTEGILYAETGSKDLIAGTTATLAAISLSPSGTSEMTVLNCGDSRTLVVGEVKDNPSESVVAFVTRDHSPDDELEIQRLQRGQDEGLDYSVPECAMGQHYLRVGDFQYALCRSLEGAFVTSKGVVSDPDITTVALSQILDERQHCALVLSCDGLFEVMSNEEVGREVVRMRKEGYKAGEIAKNLCGQALKKGSYDNISTIVVYVDNI